MIKISYVKIPKDILKIREKYFFGLTKRETMSLVISGIIGYATFLFLNQYIGSKAYYVMALIISSTFFLIYFETDGIYIEDKIKNYIYFVKNSKPKVYKSENFYNKILIEKEIKQIIKNNERR